MINFVIYYRTGCLIQKVRVGLPADLNPEAEHAVTAAKNIIKKRHGGKLPDNLQIMKVEPCQTKVKKSQKTCAQCALFAYEDVRGYGFCEYFQYGVRCDEEACDYLLPKA